MGWGLHSHFAVQPNYSVEVVLCFVVVGAVTILACVKVIINFEETLSVQLCHSMKYLENATFIF